MKMILLSLLLINCSCLIDQTEYTSTVKGKAKALCDAAIHRSTQLVVYNGAYRKLDYPNGNVPSHLGVCTDVVIRSYRAGLNIDFQKLIHEDMVSHFDQYPSKKLWGLSKADKNIDHRRTQNIECFLTRKGSKLSNSSKPSDYLPGDLVFWGDIGFGHVGIVVHHYTADSVPMVVHNVGLGPQLEDYLFSSRITGHYRWLGN